MTCRRSRSTRDIRAGVAPRRTKSARVPGREQPDPAVEGFLALASARLAPRTVEAYRRDLGHFAAWLGRSPAEASADELAAYVARLRADGLAATTIARRLAAVRSFFRHQVLLGARTDNPAALLELPRRRRALPRTLSPAEVERLLEAAAGATPRALRDRALAELLYGAGLRVSEAVGLDRQAVDLESRLVRCLGKGAKERVVPIGREAAEALRRYLARGRPYLDRRHRPELFLNAHGGPLTRAGSPARPVSSRSGSTPTCSVTPSPPTCSRAAPTCARCRRCSAMPTWRRPSSTRTYPTGDGASCTSRRTPTRAACAHRREGPHHAPQPPPRSRSHRNPRRRMADDRRRPPEEPARAPPEASPLSLLRTRAPGARLPRLLGRRLATGLRLPPQPLRHLRSGPAQVAVGREPLEQDDRLALGRAVAQRQHRQSPHGSVLLRGRGEGVKPGPDGVHRAGMVAREQLEREQRRAAGGRARVLEPAPEQLLLRPPAKHADRPEGERPFAEVRAARRRLELVVPLRPQRGELLRRAARRQLLGAHRCLGKGHRPSLTARLRKRLRYARRRWRTGSS